jgi:hypothetical protein
MDYSLLVGIHDNVKGNIDDLRQLTLSAFEPGADVIRRHTTVESQQKSKHLRSRSIAKIDSFNATSDFPKSMPSERSYCIFYEDEGG